MPAKLIVRDTCLRIIFAISISVVIYVLGELLFSDHTGSGGFLVRPSHPTTTPPTEEHYEDIHDSHAAVVYVLPESGEVDAAGLLTAYQNVLGLAGRPTIVLIAASSVISAAADTVSLLTGCEVVPVYLSVASIAPSLIGDCGSSSYERAVSSFLTSDLMVLSSVAKFSTFLLLHASLSKALTTPAPCDPFQLAQTTGSVYASRSSGGGNAEAPDHAASPACAAGLKSMIEAELAAGGLSMNEGFVKRAESPLPPLVQVLQVSVCKERGGAGERVSGNLKQGLRIYDRAISPLLLLLLLLLLLRLASGAGQRSKRSSRLWGLRRLPEAGVPLSSSISSQRQ